MTKELQSPERQTESLNLKKEVSDEPNKTTKTKERASSHPTSKSGIYPQSEDEDTLKQFFPRVSMLDSYGLSKSLREKTTKLHALSATTKGSDRNTYNSARLILTKQKQRKSVSKTKSGN
ncbi:hypothetical protein CORC01_06584 [Colletotrichum orchidophilum]|uniref:Uncharacterized protein n=1 Tax=Colletotrichum orchidophilum TaxID=1209926 RepID=A0A1G4B9H2_9PEZI|nr:uncharacterized protein CORC01_06584 [Colletotrichum orchidophilum]OHE98070.1 hypothetical protein CORC01_06584 [Colletotrichum orchidophilum]